MTVFETNELNELIKKRFEEISFGENILFEVDVDKSELWELYLNSFPEGTNEVYRERREYDCNGCKNFIKRIGNVVTIKNGEVFTVWDVVTGESKFQPVVNAMNEFVKSKPIKGVYSTKLSQIGQGDSYEQLSNGEIITWSHLNLTLPPKFVNKSNKSDAEISGEFASSKQVFKRSLDEITFDAVQTVLELTAQKSLYKGDEWVSLLNEFLKHKRVYDLLNTEEEKELYAWEKSVSNGSALTRIRNHSIGTLLVDISKDVDLDSAVRKYENIVAPSNYKRPKEIFTKRMLEEAKQTIIELGYETALSRRFATLEDITVNNVLFSNKDASKRIVDAMDVFAELESTIPENPKKFSNVSEITVEEFINNVLPTASSVEALVENKHSSNLVSLIAPTVSDSKSMFKWDNNFSWAYSGNITDSDMKSHVKNAGGKVDGVLRFSIQWNDKGFDKNDLDAYCKTPTGKVIYFGNRHDSSTNGELDVDITSPIMNKVAVENITWGNINDMKDGKYTFYVNNFANRGGTDGFRAEIEFNGELYSFDYNKELRNRENVLVAIVTLNNGKFTIKEILPTTSSSKDIWGITTNQFVPVTVVSTSPNYWNEQQGIGNKHYFFMLDNCVNDESPNGYYNEFLNEELGIKHKRVMAAMGSKMRVQETANQLSGLGFSSTQRNELIVKVKGHTERVLKVKF